MLKLNNLDITFPTRRDEAWKYTNIMPLLDVKYEIGTMTAITESQINKFKIPNLKTTLLVFINGCFAEHLSQLNKSITAISLLKAKKSRPEILERFSKPTEGSAFTLLNKKYSKDGAIIHITENTDNPIHLMFISDASSVTISQPRNLIILDPNSKTEIIETYHCLRNEEAFTNVLTEIHLNINSTLNLYRIQDESTNSSQINTTIIEQAQSSTLNLRTFTLNGALTRNTTEVNLNAPNAIANLNGIYINSGNQHVDNTLTINHLAPHCNSDQFYRGIMDGQSTGVFSGKIYVAPHAQKTIANQSNKNLLLSNRATVNTKPALEIYADDVKCSHGATSGQLDPNALFYLRSRGIGIEKARELLTYAFASEVLKKIKLEPLKNLLDTFLTQRLKKGCSNLLLK